MSRESLKKALQANIAAIQKDAGNARAVFAASTQLERDVLCSARVRDFPPLVVDEPPSLGGSDKGMNPVEMVLAALGTCQEIMYAAFAAMLGVQLDEVKVEARGNLDLRGLFSMDPAVRAGFTKVSFDVTLRSPADEATLGKIVELVQAHCPVLDSLQRPVEVSATVAINGGAPRNL